MSTTFFISDLHLDPSRPRATEAFLRFLGSTAREAAQLYILGDLFEFWIGDDDDTMLARTVQEALAEYAGRGHHCSIMRGNRDFLLGRAFAQHSGTRLLPDPSVELIHGERVLVMHGDLLCTDDHAYQRYRRRVNNPLLQTLFLALPKSLRRLIGERGRARSRDYQANRPAQITDVNERAVNAALATHEVRVLIHGHTHRPGIHHLDVGGHAASRIVLGDWYEQGSVLRRDTAGYTLQSVPFA